MHSYLYILLVNIFLLLATQAKPSQAFPYAVASTGQIRLTDVATNMTDIYTLLRGQNATIHVHDVQWTSSNVTDSGALRSARLAYTTYMNGDAITSGRHDMSGFGTVPPVIVEAGSVMMGSAGRHNLTVVLQVEYDSEVYTNQLTKHSSTRFYQTYRDWVSIFPVCVLVLLATLTGSVEISLSITNLVMVCIAQGSFFRGSAYMVGGSLLSALINPRNGFTILLVFFLGGIMSLTAVTGGLAGYVDFFGDYIKTARVAQCVAFFLGIMYFWDDTFSILIIGILMRPLLEHATTSRPMTAMILEATAGPLASLLAISTWIAWEIPLLQQEIDRLDLDEESAAILRPSEIFQRSLRYSYYPIFFLFLVPILTWSQRHFGPMLIAERTTQVYRSQDGGPEEFKGPGMTELKPLPGIPCRFWNMIIPFGLITFFFIVYGLQSASTAAHRDLQPGEDANWLDIVVETDVESASLQAISVGTTLYVVSLLLQWQQSGNVLFLPLNIGKIKKQRKMLKEEDEAPIYHDDEEGRKSTAVVDPDDIIRPLIVFKRLIRSFFFGFSRVMPYVIQFILAWAVRQGLSDIGLDRWIAASLTKHVDTMNEGMLPTVAFFVAFLMSFFTGGASRGKVASVLLPLLVKPVLEATYVGNPNFIYQIIGSVFSGCVAGDQASPISDSTLLSALSSDCHLKAHFETQLPYIFFIMLLSVGLGSLPVGYGAYPNGVTFGLGLVCLTLFVLFVCVPVMDPHGEWDIFTKLYLRIFYGPAGGDAELDGLTDNPLDDLKKATSKAAEIDPQTSDSQECSLPVNRDPNSFVASDYEEEELQKSSSAPHYETRTNSSGSLENSVEVTATRRPRRFR